MVSQQYAHIHPWADIVTCHSLPGPGVLDGLKARIFNQEKPRGCFLLAEMSSNKNLITESYKQGEHNIGFLNLF